MKIRLKLTLQFVFITALIAAVAFFIIYALSANYRKEQFYDRLFDKAVNTAKLLVDVQEIDENLLRIIDENTVSLQDERIFIYDFNNEIVYKNVDGPPLSDIALLNEIRLKKVVRFKIGQKESLGILYSGEFDRFVVMASAFDKYGLSKLNNLQWVLFFVFIGILIITFLAGWLFSGQALKPITHVIEEVKEINDQSLGLRVNEGNGTDEIADLAKTFNLMLARLEEAFYSQKSFVSHASHELRTPLTAITGQIEVALMNARTEEEYKSILKSVLEDIKNLSKLTNGLLELVQMNSSLTVENFEKTRIDDVLFKAIEQTKSGDKGVCQLILDFDDFPENEEDLIVYGNDYLLQSAFFNLLENACKFSDGKDVKIQFSHSQKDLSVKIIDKGIGISKEDINKIFQPFYRAANAISHRGYGLGLSLAKKIFTLHEAQLEINSQPLKGTTFTITFKKIKL